MMKINKIATVIIIVLTISLCASKLLPQSKEIDQMEIIKVVGLDYEDTKEDGGKATVSFTMEKDDNSGDGENAQKQSKTQEVMRYSARTCNEALKQMQFYTDKFVEGSHIKFFLIGEKTAREDIDKALDEISKDKEIRLSSHVYLVKDMNAYDFLENIISLEYELGEKLASMEKKIEDKTIVKPLAISELLSGKLSDTGVYLIPTLQYMSDSTDLEVTKENSSEQEEKLKKQFDFYGYGIMKENKLVEFLNKDEAIIYNMLINNATAGNIEIETESGKIISFGIENITSSYDFKFSNQDTLDRIVIKMEFKSNFYEIYNEDDPTKERKIDEYQKSQEKEVKKQIEKILTKTQQLNLDILNVEETLKLKHPYKYKNIKNTFKNEYKDLKFDVQVETKIERTYNVIKTHK